MAEKPESTPLKNRDWEKKAPIPNGVEKKEVQDRKKSLEDKTLKLKESRAKIAWDKEQKKDREDAQKLLNSFDLWVGDRQNKEPRKDENFVEKQEVKDLKEQEKAETEYREEIQKNYAEDKKNISQEPETLKKLESKYMEKYLGVMYPDEAKMFWEKDVEFLTQNFPNAYRELLLDKT